MIYQQIRARLQATPAVEAIVGERIYSVVAPQSARRPYIVVQQISRFPVTSLRGDKYGTYFARYQVTLIHDDIEGNHTLAAAVRSALSGWQEADSEPTTIRMDIINEIDGIDGRAGSALGISRIIHDYECSFAVPVVV